MKLLKMASINSDEIDYINAHGTSTLLGDDIELKCNYEICLIIINQLK